MTSASLPYLLGIDEHRMLAETPYLSAREERGLEALISAGPEG